MNKSQLADLLGVSRTYVTLISQGKRQPSQAIVNKLNQLGVDATYLATHVNKKLQTRWGALSVFGGFDSHPLPPGA